MKTEESMEYNKEELFKEIDLIHSCINRMSNFSLIIKGWTVSLVGISLSISQNIYIIAFLLILIFLFWYLDSFYLLTEKRYRKLYDWVVKHRLVNNKDNLFNLESSRFKSDTGNIIKTAFSKTIWPFYISLILILCTFLFLIWFSVI